MSQKTIKRFILDLLDDVENPLSIQEIYNAFSTAGYKPIRESIRGRLNELTYSKEIQRVEKGMYSSNVYSPKPIKREPAVKAMVNWFHSNYQDPVNRLPYNGREGGYQWLHGGPYNASEELLDEFSSLYSDEWIDEAIEIVEQEGIHDWDNTKVQDPDPDYFENEVIQINESTQSEFVTFVENTPQQEIGANVAIVDGKVMMATLSPEENNPNRTILENLHSDLLKKAKATANLILPTDNQYPNLGLEVSKYVELVHEELDGLNTTVLFITGADLKAEYETLLQSIEKDKYDEYPELPQKIRSSIRKLLEAHSRFIGLSEEGGILLDTFAKANRTPQEERNYRRNLTKFAITLKDENELIASDLADTVLALAEASDDDPNRLTKLSIAGRYSRHILILTGTVASLGIASGGLVLGAVTGNPILMGVGGLAGAAYELTIKEAYKKSDANKDLSALVTSSMNKLSNGDIELFQKAIGFIKKAKHAIRPIAKENALDTWFEKIHTKSDAADQNIQTSLNWKNLDVYSFLSTFPIPNIFDEREGVSVSVSCDKNIGKIKTDPSILTTILSELIHNSIVHNSNPVKILIKAVSLDSRTKISVIDNGIGIDVAEVQRKFNLGYRGPPDYVRPLGMGLGLPKVKSLIDQLAAGLQFRSNPDGGAIFEILFSSV